MLWKTHYTTRIAYGVSLPPLMAMPLVGQGEALDVKGVLLGGFHPLAESELGIWRRLLADAYPEMAVPTVFIRPQWTLPAKREIRLATPPSRHSLTWLAEDPTETWAALIEPDRPERCFAAVVRDGNASVLMIGPSTEDSWDEFMSFVPKNSD